jgi:hypothetical protein
MADAARTRFYSTTIDAASRTPITVPHACRAVVLRNADLTNNCTIYDADIGGTGITLAAGAERRFGVADSKGSCYDQDAVVVWATADAGTGPIEVECIL